MKLFIRFGVIIILMICTVSSMAQDWSAWRGPNGNFISDDTQWNPQSINSGTKVLWRADVGYGHTNVSILNGKLFTMGESVKYAGNDTTYTESVTCLDSKTGKEIWSYDYPGAHGRYPGPGATPYVDNKYLYTQTRAGVILCLNSKTGKLIWQRDLVKDGITQLTHWGCCSSPVPVGNSLLINAGSAGVSLDLATGSVIWKSENTMSGHATPVVFKEGGKVLAAIQSDRDFHIINVDNGEIVTSMKWDSDQDPVKVGSQFFLAGGHKRGEGSKLLNWKDNQLTPVWELKTLAHGFQPSIIKDGHAYAVDLKNRRSHPLNCIELSTGKIKWEKNFGEWGALLAAGEYLIWIGGLGELVVAKASSSAYEEVGRMTVFDIKKDELGIDGQPRTCWTTPVLINGNVYVRNTYGEIACISLK
ncbi:PQQ-like beta-propeller repeat protein [bacterium]|nr:PQQ-like beta-propeller repeat protein [bacterium]